MPACPHASLVKSRVLGPELHSTRRWGDRQHAAESDSFFQVKGRASSDQAARVPRCAAGRFAQLLEIASGRKELQDVHWITSGGRKASDELR